MPFWISVLLGAIAFPAYADLTLKSEVSPIPATISKPFVSLFDKDATHVESGSQTLLTFHFRSEIPMEATKDQIANGITYRELVQGSLIGCVEVHRPWTDFRKQSIPPGVYTMRLAFQPPTGDHEGTAPHTEFCLLLAAEKDTAIEPLDLEKMVALSAKVTGTAHPAVMLLFPVKKPETIAAAKLETPKDGIQTLVVAREAKGEGGKGKIGFAIVVSGVRKE